MDPREDMEAPEILAWREREAAAIEPFAEWTADHQPSPAAMDRFFGPFLLDEPDDEDVDAFAEFVLFDYREGEDHRTLVQRYLEDEADCEPEARAILEGLSRAPPSLYRIHDRVPGVGVTLVDLIRGEARVFLTDSLFAETCDEGMVVPCRLYPVGPYVFGRPCGTALEPDEAMGAVAWFEERFGEWAGMTHCVDRESFLRARPELVTQAAYIVCRDPALTPAPPPGGRSAAGGPPREP